MRGLLRALKAVSVARKKMTLQVEFDRNYRLQQRRFRFIRHTLFFITVRSAPSRNALPGERRLQHKKQVRTWQENRFCLLRKSALKR